MSKDKDKIVELETKEGINFGPSPGDKVNHPSHYKGNKLEAIDIIEDFELGFCLGNAIKYILRAGRKNPGHDEFQLDLLKAQWYITREIEKAVNK